MIQKIISGKVRDVYEVNDKELVIVTTDRISAFDVILPTPIENKGKVLTKISSFWFQYTKDIIPNHIITDDTAKMPSFFQKEEFKDRTILVKKLKMLPFEFVVRGYIFGNMWNAYQKDRTFCGYHFEEGYQQAQKLPEPILTPSTKSKEGHDEYITVETMEKELGKELSEKLKTVCLALYNKCYDYALQNGIIIADTKFEFGFDEDGTLVLADEIFTPDSSRFWNAAEYQIGTSPKSYDKQYLRDWLTSNNLNGKTPAPEIPADVKEATEKIYMDCLHKIVH